MILRSFIFTEQIFWRTAQEGLDKLVTDIKSENGKAEGKLFNIVEDKLIKLSDSSSTPSKGDDFNKLSLDKSKIKIVF